MMKPDMPTSSSLKRSLRRIPAFRSLPANRLEAIASRMTCREYQTGEVLWRSGAPDGFLGIVQQGALLVERRVRGAVIRSTRLAPGDLLAPEKLSTNNSHSFVLVRALTDVQIYILPADQLKGVGRRTGKRVRSASKWQGYQTGLWALLVAAVLLILSWWDLTRIGSGILYLFADPALSSAWGMGQRMRLLHYAGAVDGSAAFAPNGEGTLLFQDQNLVEAEAAFTEAVSRDPSNSPALNNLAVVSFLNGRYPLAVELEEKAIRNRPDDPVLRYNLGIALVATNRESEALREFMQATYIDPDWALPHVQRAYVYLQLKEYARAEDAAGEAIRLEASQETAHLVRAIALYHQGKYEQALESVEHALGLDPEDRIALFYKAMVLGGLARFDPALAILNELLNSTQDPAEIDRITTEIEAVRHFQQESLVGAP